MNALIALDLDGTLEDSRADMVASARRVRAELKLPAKPDEALLPWVTQGMEPLYLNCFDDYIAKGEGDWHRRYDDVQWLYDRDYLAHLTDQTKLYPGVAEALDKLSEWGPLAVVTNKHEDMARKLLDLLGVGGRFAVVIGGDTCGAVKPDPRLLKTAAKRLNWNGGRPFMIGDTANDVAMGRAFGATTVWCAWGYLAGPGEEKPDFTAQKPADLPELIGNVLNTAAK
jgi:phosphoglycolate phosphatase